ncbi:thioether cross-link-forming SCIFF peptide maturase [Acetobacterium fimetarium]|uniref:Thioether cross-link-forming SCIFF peptide maturase n=1 Tax=Acetobacterium fimetarium TaxID=52691 RepID=A0ABR6WYJ2_9FIRM|nr:thioether cross-link-forming SCIFF peptide maturase [Acetobacterium fimetarium]MBC3805513.1 thioether cross-link-forming SCIFF peptide maturase [Acetobacterium fimetarium]
MIHKYKLNGMNIVLDVDTSTVLTVDDLTYALMDGYPEKTRNELIEDFAESYSREEIGECLDELDSLKAEGLLFTEIKYQKDHYANGDLIKSMCLHVAHDCNLKCNYCFAAQGDFDGEKMLMPLEVGKKAIDFIVTQSKNRENLEIDFFGGEPLMNLDVVKQLVVYGNEMAEKHHKKFKYTMTTNGVLLDAETREYLNETMDNIVLSLDGRKEVNDRMRQTVNDKGSFDVIINNIKAMAELRGDRDHYVRGTYTHYNLDFSKDVQFLAEQGFKSISVEPVVSESSKGYAITEADLPVIMEEYDKLALSYLKRHEDGLHYNFFHFNVDLDQGPCVYKRLSGCGAGRDYVAVTPEGDVYPCHQFVGNEIFKMGDVFRGIENTEIRKEFEAGNLLEKEACTECWCKYFCGGGCHANAYNFNGTIMKPHNVSCEIERRRVENAIMISIVEESEQA